MHAQVMSTKGLGTRISLYATSFYHCIHQHLWYDSLLSDCVGVSKKEVGVYGSYIPGDNYQVITLVVEPDVKFTTVNNVQCHKFCIKFCKHIRCVKFCSNSFNTAIS